MTPERKAAVEWFKDQRESADYEVREAEANVCYRAQWAAGEARQNRRILTKRSLEGLETALAERARALEWRHAIATVYHAEHEAAEREYDAALASFTPVVEEGPPVRIPHVYEPPLIRYRVPSYYVTLPDGGQTWPVAIIEDAAAEAREAVARERAHRAEVARLVAEYRAKAGSPS